jgi:hypothetical protein
MFGAMIKEHECVVLTGELIAEGVKAGDIGTVVHIRAGAAACEVEFMTLVGETVALVTLAPSQFRAISPRDIACYADEGHEPLHIHCQKAEMEAKFWLDSRTRGITVAFAYKMKPNDMRVVKRVIRTHFAVIESAWAKMPGNRN